MPPLPPPEVQQGHFWQYKNDELHETDRENQSETVKRSAVKMR
jgi:hypothetical protein